MYRLLEGRIYIGVAFPRSFITLRKHFMRTLCANYKHDAYYAA